MKLKTGFCHSFYKYLEHFRDISRNLKKHLRLSNVSLFYAVNYICKKAPFSVFV